MANTPDKVEQIDSVKDEIKKCFADLGSFTPEDIDSAVELIHVKTYKKGEHLLREGEVSAKSFSVVSGCVRQYYLVDGDEKTTFFYTEGQSIFLPNMLESMSRMSLQEELINYQEMLATYITTNPEERYLNLLKYRPELLNRVPPSKSSKFIS